MVDQYVMGVVTAVIYISIILLELFFVMAVCIQSVSGTKDASSLMVTTSYKMSFSYRISTRVVSA